MNASLASVRLGRRACPFDLDDEALYQRWRADKLEHRARAARDLMVEVADAKALSPGERRALARRCADWNMAVYRSPCAAPDKDIARAIGSQIGLNRLDVNWLADEDGISSIAVSRAGAGLRQAQESAAAAEPAASDGHGGFIPYTDRAINWHTDGYYHPEGRRIGAMLLHCVRPAASGGVNALLDHELAYIALRDASPEWVHALMAVDAMTIPGRQDAQGMARPTQSGPVFWVDPLDGALHMRYTARTRSIVWKADPATQEAVGFLKRFLADDNPWALRVRLEPGMGIVANNVLHDRSAFVDDPAQPRLLYRARYLDRVAAPQEDW